jgi:cytochrome c peroxidase
MPGAADGTVRVARAVMSSKTLVRGVQATVLIAVAWAAASDGRNDPGPPPVSGHSEPAAELRSNRAPEGRDLRALARIEQPPLGLPAVPVDPDDPPTVEKIALGRKLFSDRRLSVNGTLSCAMCHVPEQGFAVNESRTAVGFEGKTLRRNSPTLLNVAFAGPFFHDGREPDLALQPIDVLTNPDEMALPSLGAVAARVQTLDPYDELFELAFAGPPTVWAIGKALAAYLQTLVSANSPFDRWHFGGDGEAMSESAIRGFELFTGDAGCVRCHTIADDHALFRDGAFHDTGLGRAASMARSTRREPVQVELAPGVLVPVERSVVQSVGDPVPNDLGRYEVTGDRADRWRFKTPSLRNVALTAPYMHDGSLSTLRQVVEFYRRGGHPHPDIDPMIRPLDLDDDEVGDLVAFLESLTGDNVEELVRDARSEAAGNFGDELRANPPR